MREVKSFFNKDNNLNKGYLNNSAIKSDESDDKNYYKKLLQNMPPIDVMAAYEELNPGTISKLLDAMGKEQSHSHALDNAYNKMNIKAQFLGRICGIFSIIIIAYVVLSLSREGMMLGGLIFALISFTGIFGISYMSFQNSNSHLSKELLAKKDDKLETANKNHKKIFKPYKNRQRRSNKP